MTIIYLASRSPRRRELLDQLGVRHEVLMLPAAAGEDEPRLPDELPADYVLRTAREKAQRASLYIRSRNLPGRAVLAADTTVILGNDILGKPRDRNDAIAMLQRLSGTRHEVRTAVVLAVGDALFEAVSVTQVHFARLTQRQIERYCDTGEPFDKAGAYGIQGPAGVFVERIEGSFTGVMGLPVFETARLLRHAGIELP